MLRLYSRLILFPGKRHSSNFVKAAGFFENTSNQEYAKRPILIQDENKHLTYEALNNRIGQYAALLHGKYGINKGDRLLSRTTKTLDTAALYFATLRLGAIYIPLNPDYTSRESTHFVNVTVVDENALANEANQQKPALEVENVQPDDVGVILYTSGTTGLPKGAMLTHKNIQSNAEALAQLWKFTKDDVLLHTLPFYHIHGMCISIGCTLMSKSAAIFRPKFSVEDTLKWMPKSTVFIGVPTYFSRLMAADEFKGPIFKNIRVFVSGSAPLTSALWESFRVHTGQPILERYGMTETLASTSNPYDHIGRRPGSVGLPVPGMDIRIGDKRVIEVKGPSVFKGYWKLPEKTKSEFTADGYFRTGDVGEIDDKGYIHIFARDKDVVICGGLNVYPKEVEDLIDTLQLVKEAAVIGVPHPDFGEAVVAVCIPKDGEFVDADLEKTLKNQLKEKLANYKRPKKVIFVDDYPRNFIGKIKKNELRAKYKALFQNMNATNAQTN
ncbi:AMP-binding enzyme domain-containing protein [Ditylenchus destructor]|nr:AMP-binding enzyme domain-containing protein [Ditylenchus destructor]